MKQIYFRHVALLRHTLVCILCLALSLSVQAQDCSNVVVNGIPWYDQNHHPVNAHGAGIIMDSGKYWLFGEYKSDTSNAFPGFGCYSSKDLVNWHFERVVLPVQKDGILGPNRVGERVKVMRCPKTGMYVMLMHADNLKYSDPHVGIATCKTVNGDYKLKGALQYKGQPIKRWDMGVFQDEDGKGYLLTHHGPIYRLSDDYLSVDTMIANVTGMGESPAMFKKNGMYYLLTSNLTSWERNDNYYFTATNIAGPWKRHGTFCPNGTLTWNSQSTFVLMLPDGTPMYMGDRWSYPHQASAATYVWMPMKADGEKLSIPSYWQSWNVQEIKYEDVLNNAEYKKPLLLNSNHTGKSVKLDFTGTHVAVIGRTDAHNGYGLVSVLNAQRDTVYSSLIDFYSKVPQEGIRVITPRLPYSQYTLEIKVTGERPNWADKRKSLYGSDDNFVQTSMAYVFGKNTDSVFTNPILGGDHPDPTIVRDGNDYYMTHSSFEYLPGLTVFHSCDLVNWEPVCSALHKYLGSVWAPDICKFKDKYYIYFTVSKGNDDFYNYVVTANSPCGPWSKPVDLKVGKWIDPCHVYDEEKNIRWLFLSGGHRIRLSDDGLSVVGKLEKVYDGWSIPRNWIVEGKALEGPKVKKIGDYYYFLNAQGGTAGPATTHMAIVARSKSVDGPWENCPWNPLIHTYSSVEKWWSKGHASLIDTHDGKWLAVYHAYDKERLNQGRQTLLEPVEVTSDGWLKAPVGADVEDPMQLPYVEENKKTDGDYDFSKYLSCFRVGKEWKGWQDIQTYRFTVKDKAITIEGKGDNPASSSPLMFVAPDRNYEMSAKFEIEDYAEAGLILYYNENFFVGLGCDKDKISCWRRGQRRGKGGNRLGKVFWLKLRFEDQAVVGYMSKDGKEWNKMQWGLEVSGYNHNTLSGFLSLLPGIYCSGKGKVKISDFQYQRLP